MAEQMTVSWKGRSYDVVRQGAGESGEPGAVWQVLQDGALVTSFPADDGDGAAEVRAKVTGWLEGTESRPEADVGRR
ncbi:MAG: hypothetical protein M3Q93_00750 [Gemmatimonadota bacterium]|nr:hypothetical protein [Gemmatimonadota bacterium]